MLLPEAAGPSIAILDALRNAPNLAFVCRASPLKGAARGRDPAVVRAGSVAHSSVRLGTAARPADAAGLALSLAAALSQVCPGPRDQA